MLIYVQNWWFWVFGVFFPLLVLNYTPRTDMLPVGKYVTGLFAATANQQV